MPKKSWIKKKEKGKATARALTANELLTRQEKQKERQQRQQQEFAQAQANLMAQTQNHPSQEQDTIEVTALRPLKKGQEVLKPSNSGPGEVAKPPRAPQTSPPSPPAGQGKIQVPATPERPRLRRAPSPDTPASPASTTDSLENLPSLFGFSNRATSVLAAEEAAAPASTAPPALGRGKRKKMPTARMAEARDQHLV